MNWEAIGAVGELVGATAVVITLAYLAAQIRYAHRVAADSNRQTRAVGVRDMMMRMATDERFRSTWNRAAGGDQKFEELANALSLTNDEACSIDYGVMYWVWVHWAQYNSTTTESDLVELKGVIGVWYSQEPLRTVLEKSPHLETIDPEFLKLIRQAVEENRRT